MKNALPCVGQRICFKNEASHKSLKNPSSEMNEGLSLRAALSARRSSPQSLSRQHGILFRSALYMTIPGYQWNEIIHIRCNTRVLTNS